jgi:hypothetical protein
MRAWEGAREGTYPCLHMCWDASSWYACGHGMRDTRAPGLKPCGCARIVTAAALGAAGDLVAQLLEGRGATDSLQYNVRRGLGMITFCGLYSGAFQSWWISTLNAKVQLLNPLADAALKTALCQFGTIPILYLPAFFLVTGFFGGKTLRLCIAEAKSNYQRLFSRNLCFWIPVQMFQFLLVRPDWQIPFLCMAGFSWCMILSSHGLSSKARVPLRA